MNLPDKKAYYIIASAYSENQDMYTNELLTEKLKDTLYRLEYDIIKLGDPGNKVSFLAYKENCEDNNLLRKESLSILDQYYQDDIIVKYYNTDEPCLIKKNGHESPLKLISYDGSDKSYFTNGVAFSFEQLEEYFIPKNKKDFKKGMLIEILNNNNNWVAREVINVDSEWNEMLELLVKYERVRCLISYDDFLKS